MHAAAGLRLAHPLDQPGTEPGLCRVARAVDHALWSGGELSQPAAAVGFRHDGRCGDCRLLSVT
ncbi:hypothetical protein [Kribbella sp. NBC_00889]|uniref:hypothetical protein n=1 Tax=Kribbella sp. NBC_00889 TaxID=2975974 RepID=UPI0038685DAA|nr:hypothetical protein OG817_33650 [Kribbella sp. NBC_00889]